MRAAAKGISVIDMMAEDELAKEEMDKQAYVGHGIPASARPYIEAGRMV